MTSVLASSCRFGSSASGGSSIGYSPNALGDVGSHVREVIEVDRRALGDHGAQDGGPWTRSRPAGRSPSATSLRCLSRSGVDVFQVTFNGGIEEFSQ